MRPRRSRSSIRPLLIPWERDSSPAWHTRAVLQDALTLEYRKEIIGFALRERLPSMFVGKLWAEEGGLMCYGDRLPERYRRAADVVDRILKGEKPADLPVQSATKYETVINLKTAKALGLDVPAPLLARADVVIE